MNILSLENEHELSLITAAFISAAEGKKTTFFLVVFSSDFGDVNRRVPDDLRGIDGWQRSSRSEINLGSKQLGAL